MSKCDCEFHRYHLVHICRKCNVVTTHSQADWEEHKHHGDFESIPSQYYRHGDTPDALRLRAPVNHTPEGIVIQPGLL